MTDFCFLDYADIGKMNSKHWKDLSRSLATVCECSYNCWQISTN